MAEEQKDSQQEITTTPKVIDRRLGDEWAGWVGDLSGYEKEIKEGKELFLSVYFAALIFLTAGAMFIYYMIAPRLYQWNPIVDLFVMRAIVVFLAVLFIWSLLLLVSVSFNVAVLPFARKNGLHIEWIYPVVYKIGAVFKVSKDRIGHSLVEVNNALVYATRKKFKSQNLLVLLPRCLDKETRLKAAELTEKYKVTSFTATGGSSARQMIKKVKPDAIIGVACERDLIAGMSDTPGSMTVVGIPNKRPFGPCKDTAIDTDTLENTIKFLLKIA